MIISLTLLTENSELTVEKELNSFFRLNKRFISESINFEASSQHNKLQFTSEGNISEKRAFRIFFKGKL